jgi:hypothetical protein
MPAPKDLKADAGGPAGLSQTLSAMLEILTNQEVCHHKDRRVRSLLYPPASTPLKHHLKYQRRAKQHCHQCCECGFMFTKCQ